MGQRTLQVFIDKINHSNCWLYTLHYSKDILFAKLNSNFNFNFSLSFGLSLALLSKFPTTHPPTHPTV